MANDPVTTGMREVSGEKLPHMRYAVHQVSVIVTDPYSGKKKYIVMNGIGTVLVEPVIRNTDVEDNKTKVFNGNQASITMSILAMREDEIK